MRVPNHIVHSHGSWILNGQTRRPCREERPDWVEEELSQRGEERFAAEAGFNFEPALSKSSLLWHTFTAGASLYTDFEGLFKAYFRDINPSSVEEASTILLWLL